jgi:hypothetical protein
MEFVSIQDECEFLLACAVTHGDNCVMHELDSMPFGLALTQDNAVATLDGVADKDIDGFEGIVVYFIDAALKKEFKATAIVYKSKLKSDETKDAITVEVDHVEGHSSFVQVPINKYLLDYEATTSEEGKYRIFGKVDDVD